MWNVNGCRSKKDSLMGIFLRYAKYFIQHCFICRTSDSTMSEDAGIKPWTVATAALVNGRSYHSARSHPQMTVYRDGIHKSTISLRLLEISQTWGFYLSFVYAMLHNAIHEKNWVFFIGWFVWIDFWNSTCGMFSDDWRESRALCLVYTFLPMFKDDIYFSLFLGCLLHAVIRIWFSIVRESAQIIYPDKWESFYMYFWGSSLGLLWRCT